MLQRQDVADGLEPLRILLRRHERPRDERHRQQDQVDHRRGPVGRPDHRRRPQAHPCERCRAEQHDRDERGDVLRAVGVEDRDAEREHHDRLQDEDDQHREHRGGQVGRRRQRRRPDALQQAALAPDHEQDGEAREGGVRGAVAEQPDEEEVTRAIPVDRAVVHRAEQKQEDDREEEDEEGALAVAPEDALLARELVP